MSLQSYFERYRFQEFAWFPAGSIEKALEHISYNAAALHMSNAFNTTDQLKTLLDAMGKSGKVKALFIPENKVGDKGCELIKDYLKKDRSLKYLFLEQNDITSEGLKLITEGLHDNKTLKTLMIGANNIDDEGARYIAELLRTNNNLREFAIGTKITDTGALYIAKGLNYNNSLKAIYLLNNDIDMLGARVLAEVVSRHPSCDNVEVVSKKVSLQQFQDMLKHMAEVEMKKAFEAAVLNNEEGPWLRSKIMVVGQGRAGKTATVRSLLGLSFDPALESTVGASISQSTTKNSNNQWNKVSENAKIDFTLDTASRITALKIALKRSQDAETMEKFDIEEFAEKYKELAAEREELERQEEEKRKRDNILPGVMTKEEIAQNFKAELVTNKNAELDDISFTIWDYGGQQVFYTLHHLFLTRYGIYLLVFDMRDVVCKDAKDEKEKEEKHKETLEYLTFWLNSVSMHAADAPLLIIGTFLDAVNSVEELKEVNEFIKKLVDKKFEQVVKNHNMYFFPVNNKNPIEDATSIVESLGGNFGRGIEIIRDTVEKVAREEEFVNQKLSLRWMKCLDTMLTRNESYLQLQEVRKIAKDVGIESVTEVDNMLQFFHELGMIVHLTSTQNLREIVTTKPQWLVDALSKVIRDEKLHKFDEATVKAAGLIKDMETMFTKNIVTSDWLEYLWNKDQVGFLIDLMKRTMLISDWKFGEFVNDTAYLVPSLIQHENKDQMVETELALKDFVDQQFYLSPSPKANGIVFDFSNSFLPSGVFQRLMCLCVFHSTRESETERKAATTKKGKEKPKRVPEPELYKNSAVIYMGEGQVLRLSKYGMQIFCQVETDHWRAFKMLQSMMQKLKSDVMGKGLGWEVYFETIEKPRKPGAEATDAKGNYKHVFLPYDEVKQLKLSPWFAEEEKEAATPEEISNPESNINLEDFLVVLENM